MALREDWHAYRRKMEAFNLWEAGQRPVERPPADLIADLGALWSWLPPDVRLHDPDPEKLGVRSLHRALRTLGNRP